MARHQLPPGRGNIFVSTFAESLREKHPGILTIIVPRHPRRGPSIRRTLSGETDVADKLGPPTTPRPRKRASTLPIRLASLMHTLHAWLLENHPEPDGGQNPLEAARVGSAVLFEPNMTFREMADRILARAQPFKSIHAADLSDNLSRLLSAPGIENCGTRRLPTRMRKRERWIRSWMASCPIFGVDWEILLRTPAFWHAGKGC